MVRESFHILLKTKNGFSSLVSVSHCATLRLINA